jgi:hypothetical protein
MAPVLKAEVNMEEVAANFKKIVTELSLVKEGTPFPRPANIMMLMVLALKGAMDVQSECQSASAVRMQTSQNILSDQKKDYETMALQAKSSSSKALGGAGYWGTMIGVALLGFALGCLIPGGGMLLGVGLGLLLGGGMVLGTQLDKGRQPDFFKTLEIDQSVMVSIQTLTAALGAVGDCQNNEMTMASKSLSGAAEINQSLAQMAIQMIQSLANVMSSRK